MRNFVVIGFMLIGTWHGGATSADALRESSQRALLQAIDSNDVRAVGRALDGGADPNAYDVYGVALLVRAVARGNEAVVTELLNRGANPNPIGSVRTPLEIAMQFVVDRRITCNVPFVKLLLQHGAHPNDVLPGLGEMPLSRALELGDTACVNTLLNFGADPHRFSKRGKPVLQAAVDGASRTNQIDLVNRMLALGFDVNGPPDHRGGPLIEATAHDNVTLVRLLLRLGADPCLAEPRKVNSWDFAQSRGVNEIVELMAPYHCRF